LNYQYLYGRVIEYLRKFRGDATKKVGSLSREMAPVQKKIDSGQGPIQSPLYGYVKQTQFELVSYAGSPRVMKLGTGNCRYFFRSKKLSGSGIFG
jgi:hypothetical protein